MMTYVVVMVRREKDDRERRRRLCVKAENFFAALSQMADQAVNGWRVVRVSEGGYH